MPGFTQGVRIAHTDLDPWQADWQAARDKQTVTEAERSPQVPTLGVNAVVRRERAPGRVRA